MKIKLATNAAYIYLVDSIEPGGVAKTYRCEGGSINLDFDKRGRLLGIEVLDANRILPTSLLTKLKKKKQLVKKSN
jgi:uncharacterized protein YuzE